jgi:hypothetical protein
MALAAPATNFAQNAPETIETVTVTGVRRSLEQSVGLKRMAGTVQDSISALELGKFPDDNVAADAAKALRDAGFGEPDLLSYTSAELFPALNDMMRTASGAAGFGYQVTLMRRYMTLASAGCGWLVVYAPDEARTEKVRDAARRFGARSAVRYGSFASEDLI